MTKRFSVKPSNAVQDAVAQADSAATAARQAAVLAATSLMAPSPPRLVAMTPDNGFSNRDFVTNVALPTFRGTGTTGSRVFVEIDGVQAGYVTVGRDSVWQFTPRSSLSAGNHLVSVFGRTATGERINGNQETVIIDRVGPVLSVDPLGAEQDMGVSATDGITNNNNIRLSGTGEAGSQISIINYGRILTTLTVPQSGNWAYDLRNLVDSTYQLIIRETDRAGNIATYRQTLVIDTVLAQPQLPSLSQDSGAADGVTNFRDQIFSGRVEEAAIIQILDPNGNNLIRDEYAIVQGGAFGAWQTTSLITGLAYGTYTVRITDLAGNTSLTNLTITNSVGGSDFADRFLGYFAAEESFSGAGGNDFIDARGGQDTLDGGSDADTLDGGLGDDLLIGGDGDDLLYVDNFADTPIETTDGGVDSVLFVGDFFDGTNDRVIDLGAGHPIYDNIERYGVFLDAASGNSTVTGSRSDDWFIGTENNNLLSGLDGDDLISGGSGNDTIIGGNGNDTIRANDGNDAVSVDSGNDVIDAGGGDDQILITGGWGHLINGGGGNDYVAAVLDSNYNTLSGGSGEDTISAVGAFSVITLSREDLFPVVTDRIIDFDAQNDDQVDISDVLDALFYPRDDFFRQLGRAYDIVDQGNGQVEVHLLAFGVDFLLATVTVINGTLGAEDFIVL